jgi:Cu(I)/Ag(I) efflux system membrane fusion protein/cobalt-zinc-cadmium efflux system membrane fusion protein
VPQEAVIDSGVRKRVFVSRGKGKFEPREVTLGVEGNDYTFEVIDGLSEGDEIVLSGQFMFDSESRLKEAIAKMLESRNPGTGDDADELDTDDLDMDGLTMDSDGPADSQVPEKETTP